MCSLWHLINILVIAPSYSEAQTISPHFSFCALRWKENMLTRFWKTHKLESLQSTKYYFTRKIKTEPIFCKIYVSYSFHSWILITSMSSSHVHIVKPEGISCVDVTVWVRNYVRALLEENCEKGLSVLDIWGKNVYSNRNFQLIIRHCVCTFEL